MAMKFKRKESVRRGVKHLACKRLGKALEHLRHCQELEAVHEVRKDIKQLRALLRLVREAMPYSQYRFCSRRLRKAGAELGVARDAHVKLNALRNLVSHYRSELPPASLADLKRLLAADCRDQQSRLSVAHTPGKVRKILADLCDDRRSFRIKCSGWAAIGPGIKRSYRCGRRAFKQARNTERAEDFHEWRKRVKDLFYQIGLLKPIWPEQLAAAEAELKHLGDYLGDDHDLVLLTEPGMAKRFRRRARAEASELAQLVARRQRELRDKAIALGSRFYREKPSLFCKRLSQYWAHWRDKSSRKPITA